VLLLVLFCVLFEHEILEGHEVEHALLEVYHQQVVIVRLPLLVRLVVKVKTHQNVINCPCRHYYQEKYEEKVHLNRSSMII